jgi:hypothetical protein
MVQFDQVRYTWQEQENFRNLELIKMMINDY